MTTIITKNSSTASAVPASGDLVQGELAVNVTDKKVFTKNASGTVVRIVGTLGSQEASAVAITGGSITGMSTPSGSSDVANKGYVDGLITTNSGYATAAAASATAAASSASSASTYATNASNSATSASTYATNASTSASAASTAQTAAEAARDATLSAYDQFDDRYLGSKTSDPSVDNDGNALVAGSLYYNSVSQVMKLYTGSAWVAAYVSGSGYLASANNLSDVASAATARTNLGLVIGTNVQAYDADLTTWGAKTAPSGTVVGDTDTQTLTNKTFTGYTETVYNLTGTALDPANGTIQTKTLSGNTTFTDSLAAGQSILIGIDDGTAYTVTWPTITWTTNPASAPTLATSGYTWVLVWKVGSTLYGKY